MHSPACRGQQQRNIASPCAPPPNAWPQPAFSGGVAFRICGFTVIAERGGKLAIRVPSHRDECGRWAPSLGRPQELHAPIAKLALDSLGVKHAVVIRPPAA
jgi:hypothetical protein